MVDQYERLAERGTEVTLDDLTEAAPLRIKSTISPRHFEAAAMRCCQVLFDGRSSGAMEPMVHFIPLRKDFSNFDEVLELFRDANTRGELTENAYRDLIASGQYSYRRFIERFDQDRIDAGLDPEVPDSDAVVATRAVDRGRRWRTFKAQVRSISNTSVIGSMLVSLYRGGHRAWSNARPRSIGGTRLSGTSSAGRGSPSKLGITEPSTENLARFDAAYMEMYPYLDRYLPGSESAGMRLLKDGLGYGTVSQILAARGLDYHGLDIAPGPVEMVRFRLEQLGLDDPEGRVRVGSVLEIDHPDQSFDHVVTIGCLHHTGDIGRAVKEVERVLRPGGRAMVMLYNRHSYRRMRMALARLPRRLRGDADDDEEMREAYDRNLE